MTTFFTRACCAFLSILGAPALVAFANPTSAMGSFDAAHTAPVAVIAASVTTALRG